MSKPRVASVDILRGAVMVLMAIDHVRVYSGLPPGGPTPGIFFTRWITHFCAPGFVFFAGTSAFLHGEKLDDRGRLSRFLITRGLWLVLLELSVVRLGWTFNLGFERSLLAGVIWVLGWSMIVLAGMIHLPVRAIGAIGGVIVFGHNLLDGTAQRLAEQPGTPLLALWQAVYGGGPIQLGAVGPTLFVLYVLVPWVGVMMLGYAFGPVLRMEESRRSRTCLALGLGLSALFVVLRALHLYGDPRPWGTGQMPVPLSFLNATKYPASLQFLLMTLGPVIALLPLLERAKGRLVAALSVFGQVPLFYYLLHIPLIHLMALGIASVQHPEAVSWLLLDHPVMVPEAPAGAVWGLGQLYLVTATAVVVLYWACAWYAGVKRRTRSPWLSYL